LGRFRSPSGRHHLGPDRRTHRRQLCDHPRAAAPSVALAGRAEILVTTIEDQITATMQTAGRPFVPLLGTLFIFLVCANLSGVLPG
jgi:hypothetical protein